MTFLARICLATAAVVQSGGAFSIRQAPRHMHWASRLLSMTDPSPGQSFLDLDDLFDMDVVLFTKAQDDDEGRVRIGAIQEDGSLAPLSVWTTEPAFAESLEFVVDENDRFSINKKDVKIISQVPEERLSYGSRQCARGVHNPHGEESELLYYIEQNVIEEYNVDLKVNPDLEMLW